MTTARRGRAKLEAGGPVSAKETDAGPLAAAPVHPVLTIHLTCETCGEELLAAFPRGAGRYGTVDCPSCGSGYLCLLAPRSGVDALPLARVG
jgi:hypothetical protein